MHEETRQRQEKRKEKKSKYTKNRKSGKMQPKEMDYIPDIEKTLQEEMKQRIKGEKKKKIETGSDH